MKPVGQEHVETKKGVFVDKDVLLFKEHFHINDRDEDMSPLLIPPGFTRNYLDGNMRNEILIETIEKAFCEIEKRHDFVIVEGTGHCGVGSIVNLNNAQAAHLLQLPVVLIASGGLGSAFDQLTLNKYLCDAFNVPVVGVILNRVKPEKKEMIERYIRLALQRWKIPLLGCIPFDPLLSYPAMKDFESLFNAQLITGEQYRLRHFKHIHLVASSVENYRDRIVSSQLLITPAMREDIILATLATYWEHQQAYPDQEFSAGMILTGDFPPRHHIVEEIRKASIPMLYTPLHSDEVMQMINSFTAKIRTEDLEKIQEAIQVVEQHINFPLLRSLI